MTAAKLELSLALSDNENTRPLLDGGVHGEGIWLVPTAVHPSEMLWRQLKFGDFDVSKMSMSSLFIATGRGPTQWVALPVFTSREFFHTRILVGQQFGSNMFVVVSVLLMILFGAVLEGAPALIIFGPLLAPIAAKLGVHPLHFGTVLVIAMGLGLFSPPIGLGLFATCAITNTKLENVWRPMLKYLLVLFVVLLMLVFVPAFSLWLPARLGLA